MMLFPLAHCPQCGAAIPEPSEHGLCPRCVFAKAMQPTADTGAASPSPPDLEVIQRAFPHLEVIGLIGSGGMGAVFKARQPKLDRFVALKILPDLLADQPGFPERFQREAQTLAKLSHPHIVTVHDYGQAGGFYYLLMEFVDGVNLRQLLQTKRLTPKEALSIVPPVCDALQCAHDLGIVHRDIKPENLLIDKAGVVKIADFGIAKIIDNDAVTDAHGEAGNRSAHASLPLGTPDYAAPEQASGTTDHRADIYSLGVVLYEMLTGERPQDKIEAPSKRVQVDIRIDEIVLRALEKTPELRFATAAEFRTQVVNLTQASSKPPPSSRVGQRWLAAGLFAVLMLGVWSTQSLKRHWAGLGLVELLILVLVLALGVAGWVILWPQRRGHGVPLRAGMVASGIGILLFVTMLSMRAREGGRLATEAAQALAKQKGATFGPDVERNISSLNDYLDGSAAFLRGDRAALQTERNKFTAGDEINRDNNAVHDRLPPNFGKSYREAYGGSTTAIQNEAIRLAREKLDRAQQLWRSAITPKTDVIEAEGDLALAEAGDDPVKRAQVNAETASRLLEVTEALFSHARVSAIERERAMQRKAKADLELRRVLNARGQSSAPSMMPAAATSSDTPPKSLNSSASPLTSSLTDSDSSPAAIARAQQLGIAEATRDIQAGIRRILVYGLLTPETGTERDEQTGYRLQRVAGSILSGVFQAEAAAYNYAMREQWQAHDQWNLPGKNEGAAKPAPAR